MRKKLFWKVVIFVFVFLYMYFCIYKPTGEVALFFFIFLDTSKTTMLDLPRKIWRIKTQNNIRNLFTLKILKLQFLIHFDYR